MTQEPERSFEVYRKMLEVLILIDVEGVSYICNQYPVENMHSQHKTSWQVNPFLKKGTELVVKFYMWIM